MSNFRSWTGPLAAAALTVAGLSAARADDGALNLLGDQLRLQGMPCKHAQSATPDPDASRPDERVWIVKCDDVSYRMRLIPNMRAQVEKLKSNAPPQKP